MSVRKVGARYVVEFQQAGVRVFRRLRQGQTKADAQALETKLRADIFKTRTLGIAEEMPLAAAIQSWLKNVAAHQKDGRHAISRAKAWAPFVAGRALREAPAVATEAIAIWTSGEPRSKNGNVGPATVNRRLAILKATCKWAYQQGLIDTNLSGRIRALREPPGREVYLTRAQVMSLAGYAPTSQSKAAIIILAYTGLRVSELLALPAVTSHQVTLSIVQSKTGKPRLVPVPKPAQPFLRALPLGLSYWQLHSEFLVARKRAGLEHVRIHDLRHSCASMLIQAGVDLYTVGKILGHSSMMTTQRYAHLADRTLKRAMARLR